MSVDQFVGVPHFPPAREIQRGIADDAVQPGAERLIGPEATQRPMRMEKTFLHRVFGVFVREQDSARHCIRALLMPPDELCKG